MKCIIVEDEKASQEILEIKLKKYYPDIEIIGVIEEFEKAHQFLKTEEVDLVFLDNHLKGGNGINLLRHFPDRNFKVIVVSAYAEYAVDALNQSAIFYLLKPFKDSDFKKAVDKGIQNKEGNRPFFVISSGIDHIIYYDELLYAKATGAYSEFYLESGKKIIASKNVGFFEEKLPENEFFRIHHSILVNVKKVRKVLKGKKAEVVLFNDTCLPISQRRLKPFLDQLKGASNNQLS